jgi:hypothetical protein
VWQKVVETENQIFYSSEDAQKNSKQVKEEKIEREEGEGGP